MQQVFIFDNMGTSAWQTLATQAHRRRAECVDRIGRQGGRLTDRVIFWDFDGTLGFGPHGAGSGAACLVEALDELHPGHGLAPSDVRPFTKGRYPWHKADTPHVHLDSADKWWAPLEHVFYEAFSGLGFEETATNLAARTRHYLADGSRWGLYEDTLPVLSELRDRGWRHVVLSNNIPELEANLAQVGLTPLVEHVICSAVIGYEKPHPEAYRYALEVAGDPAVRWMVGDSYTADVVGAEQAGIAAVLVRRRHPEAKRVAEDLAAAAALITARTSHA
jgi:putative hydrolase of the HAD superfamily